MKKLISAIMLVAVMFSFVGCEKKYKTMESTGIYEGLTYPKFLNTDWGMTKEEAFEALGTKEEEIPADKRYIDGNVQGYEVNINFEGKPFPAGLHFKYNKDDSSKDLGLYRVQLAITSQEMHDEIEAIYKRFEFFNDDAYTVFEKKGIADDIMQEARKASPFPEGMRGTAEEWADSVEQSVKSHLTGQYLSSVRILESNDEAAKDEKMPFGYAIFTGENLAILRCFDKAA